LVEMWRRGRAWVAKAAPLGVAVGALWLYGRTLAPGTVYFQDVAEFQTKLYSLEIIHATGYPYYQIVGKLWLALLPAGSVAWRVNLLSAAFAALALACLAGILQRARVQPWAILSACALLACSQSFWSYSILASTYTMHVALVALATLALLRWQEGRGSPIWFALACGVGLAHHRVFVIALPAFAATLWLAATGHAPVASKKLDLLKLGVWAATPVLLSLVWLARLGVWPLETLWHYLFQEGQQYVGHVASLAGWGRRLVDQVGPWLTEPYGLFLTLAGIGGWLVWLWPGAGRLRAEERACKRRTAIALLAQGVAVVLFFSLFWIEPDDRRYFLTADWALAGGWALAWDGLWQRVRLTWRRRGVSWAAQVGLAALILAPLAWLYPKNLAATARWRDGYADRVSREVLATVESNATLVGDWILAWPLRYYHQIEGLRPDVQVLVGPGNAYRDTATALARAGAPLYFRAPMYGLDWPDSGFEWATLAGGHLGRALPARPSLAHAQEVGQGFAGGAALDGFGLSSWPLSPDTFVRLSLQWSNTGELDPQTGFLLQLQDANGRTRWRYETAWEKLLHRPASETDVYWITPPTLAPGEYTFSVVLYHADTLETLGQARLGPIPVVEGAPLPAERLVLENPLDGCSESSDVCVLGYGFLDRELWVGHAVPLALFWRVIRVPAAPVSVSLALERDGQRHPISADCPVAAPYLGALVETPCVLLMPADVAPGRYSLVAVVRGSQVSGAVALQSLRVRDRPRDFRLPSMQVRLQATLGDGIALLGYDLSPATVRTGQTFELTLYWQALQPGQVDYKVFTHLIGPDGTLVGQHDSPPAGGAAPTWRWVAGEVIADRHPITVPAGAPVGEYALYVGMYAPDTGERLPAWDEQGVPFANRAIPLQPLAVRASE